MGSTKAILAIDPGPAESAWAVFQSGVVCAKGKEANDELLCNLPRYLDRAEDLAVEMIASYGMPVGREVFETCVWIGRFIERAHDDGFRARLVYRKDVKMHLCHSMKAKDGNIRQALIDKLGPVGTKKNPGPCYGISGDVWAALAVAVTAAETKEAPLAE